MLRLNLSSGYPRLVNLHHHLSLNLFLSLSLNPSQQGLAGAMCNSVSQDEAGLLLLLPRHHRLLLFLLLLHPCNRCNNILCILHQCYATLLPHGNVSGFNDLEWSEFTDFSHSS